MTETGNKPYLTVPEVAAIFSVAEETVYRWLKTGKLPGIHVGRTWRISQEDIERKRV